MYFTTPDLLMRPPKEALVMLLNGTRNTHLLPATALVRNVRSLGGVDTEVTIEAIPTDTYLHHPYHRGVGVFQYKRIPLALLAGISIPLQLPTSTHDVVLAISRVTGIQFDLNEIVLETCRTEVVTLTARDDSLRWVGSVDLHLDGSMPPLSNILAVNVLRDLQYPPKCTPLSDLLSNNVLDDLHYPGYVKPHLSTLLRGSVLTELQYVAPSP